MSVIIGSARIDENGNISGRKGDQTGREVAQEVYYRHKYDWDAMRCIYPEKALMISYDMASMCNNDNFGYSQPDRDSGFREAKKVGFDAAKVNTPCNIDCSRGVGLCLAYAGYDVGDFYTGNEYDVIMATGAFIDVTDQFDHDTGEGLCSGDILVTKKKGHTVIVTQGRDPRPEPAPAPEPEPVPAPTIKPYPVNDGEDAVYRLYNPNSGEHLLTRDIDEANICLSVGWIDEGVAFVVPEKSDEPVIRARAEIHMYTNDIKELASLIESGWSVEQVAFYAGGEIPVYRLYNPNSGDHLYTVREDEKNHLISLGWIDEGVRFNALRLPT